MAINVSSSNYGGEVLGNLLAKLALENELVRNGLIHVQPDVQYKFAIPRIKVGNLLQKRNADPRKNAKSKGDVTYDERELVPTDFMAYTEFNPASFEHIWREFQPKGNLVFEQLPGNVQSKLLDAITNQIEEEIGDQYINGIYDSTDGLMNGIVARILADGDTKYISTTETTISGKLKAIYKSIDKRIVNSPRLKFIMSANDAMTYDFELKENTYKNADLTKKQGLAFNAVPVVGLAQWPEGLIVATLASADEASNLWAGVNLQSDENVLQVDKTENASELYFVKLLMKADTNVAFGEYVTVCDGREADGEYVQAITATANVTTIAAGKLGATITYTSNPSSGTSITILDKTVKKGETLTLHYNGTAWV